MSLAESIAHWSEHQVADLPLDITAEQSLAAMNIRNATYPGLLELMPTSQPGKVVLDFGCGPGHDVVGFLLNGATAVHAFDVSPKARAMTEARITAHGFLNAQVMDRSYNCYFYDHIHTAGVIHHIPRPHQTLRFLKNFLRDDGEIRMMVYSSESDFYQRIAGGDPALFARLADGEAPITRAWSSEEVVRMCRAAGLRAAYVGSYRHPGEMAGPGLSSCWSLKP
jgi:cyclopropane fatty-acyl-phospholipid synthase-like methyltransferase